MQPLKIAVLGSGKGSNFRAILNAAMAGHLKIQPVLAISDNADAGLLNLAENLGVATRVVSEPKFRTRLSEEVEAGLVEETSPDFDARMRVYALRREGMAQVKAWLDQSEQLWTEQLAALKQHIESS